LTSPIRSPIRAARDSLEEEKVSEMGWEKRVSHLEEGLSSELMRLEKEETSLSLNKKYWGPRIAECTVMWVASLWGKHAYGWTWCVWRRQVDARKWEEKVKVERELNIEARGEAQDCRKVTKEADKEVKGKREAEEPKVKTHIISKEAHDDVGTGTGAGAVEDDKDENEDEDIFEDSMTYPPDYFQNEHLSKESPERNRSNKVIKKIQEGIYYDDVFNPLPSHETESLSRSATLEAYKEALIELTSNVSRLCKQCEMEEVSNSMLEGGIKRRAATKDAHRGKAYVPNEEEAAFRAGEHAVEMSKLASERDLCLLKLQEMEAVVDNLICNKEGNPDYRDQMVEIKPRSDGGGEEYLLGIYQQWKGCMAMLVSLSEGKEEDPQEVLLQAMRSDIVYEGFDFSARGMSQDIARQGLEMQDLIQGMSEKWRAKEREEKGVEALEKFKTDVLLEVQGLRNLLNRDGGVSLEGMLDGALIGVRDQDREKISNLETRLDTCLDELRTLRNEHESAMQELKSRHAQVLIEAKDASQFLIDEDKRSLEKLLLEKEKSEAALRDEYERSHASLVEESQILKIEYSILKENLEKKEKALKGMDNVIAEEVADACESLEKDYRLERDGHLVEHSTLLMSLGDSYAKAEARLEEAHESAMKELMMECETLKKKILILETKEEENSQAEYQVLKDMHEEYRERSEEELNGFKFIVDDLEEKLSILDDDNLKLLESNQDLNQEIIDAKSKLSDLEKENTVDLHREIKIKDDALQELEVEVSRLESENKRLTSLCQELETVVAEEIKAGLVERQDAEDFVMRTKDEVEALITEKEGAEVRVKDLEQSLAEYRESSESETKKREDVVKEALQEKALCQEEVKRIEADIGEMKLYNDKKEREDAAKEARLVVAYKNDLNEEKRRAQATCKKLELEKEHMEKDKKRLEAHNEKLVDNLENAVEVRKVLDERIITLEGQVFTLMQQLGTLTGSYKESGSPITVDALIQSLGQAWASPRGERRSISKNVDEIKTAKDLEEGKADGEAKVEVGDEEGSILSKDAEMASLTSVIDGMRHELEMLKKEATHDHGTKNQGESEKGMMESMITVQQELLEARDELSKQTEALSESFALKKDVKRMTLEKEVLEEDYIELERQLNEVKAQTVKHSVEKALLSQKVRSLEEELYSARGDLDSMSLEALDRSTLKVLLKQASIRVIEEDSEEDSEQGLEEEDSEEEGSEDGGGE